MLPELQCGSRKKKPRKEFTSKQVRLCQTNFLHRLKGKMISVDRDLRSIL
jgi:hypothetical protein